MHRANHLSQVRELTSLTNRLSLLAESTQLAPNLSRSSRGDNGLSSADGSVPPAVAAAAADGSGKNKDASVQVGGGMRWVDTRQA